MTVRELIVTVAEAYSVPPDDIINGGRAKDPAHARALVYYMLCEHAGLTKKQVGRYFGRHASSITHGCQQARQRIASSAEARDAYEYTLRRVREHTARQVARREVQEQEQQQEKERDRNPIASPLANRV